MRRTHGRLGRIQVPMTIARCKLVVWPGGSTAALKHMQGMYWIFDMVQYL